MDNSKQYEYKYISFDGGDSKDSEETIEALNKLGLAGWRLISNLHENEQFYRAWKGLFMREIIKEEK